MSFCLFFLFLPNLFNFFFCQISPIYKFFFTINDNQYEITMENNPSGNSFSAILINKNEITLTFSQDPVQAYFNYNSVFPAPETSKSSTGGSFNSNSLLECTTGLKLLKSASSMDFCSLIGHFDQPNYPNSSPFSITFKAEEIKTDLNEDDNALVVNVLILTSIISLIILYYLLLLLCA